jgi:hypothetical protein
VIDCPQLAVGCLLDEIKNGITRETACWLPARSGEDI